MNKAGDKVYQEKTEQNHKGQGRTKDVKAKVQSVGKESRRIAILGGGNIGSSVARGLVSSGRYTYDDIIITRRNVESGSDLIREGFSLQGDNKDAVRRSIIVILAVRPLQLPALLEDIREEVNSSRHILISLVTGVELAEIRAILGKDVPLVRAMPNTAIAVRESMTCLSIDRSGRESLLALSKAKSLFELVGKTAIIEERLMVPATALCACGIAFFLRAIRAASQGGIEIGFHSDEALLMSAQTAKGAACLLLSSETPPHPESGIDKVTTPRGCTIAGLNTMEYEGFSSAMIKGIVVSSEKAATLYATERR